MWKSLAFWEALDDVEKVFTFQSDSWFVGNMEQSIESYDYVGSPWCLEGNAGFLSIQPRRCSNTSPHCPSTQQDKRAHHPSTPPPNCPSTQQDKRARRNELAAQVAAAGYVRPSLGAGISKKQKKQKKQ